MGKGEEGMTLGEKVLARVSMLDLHAHACVCVLVCVSVYTHA